jgi:hypothetical protein
MPGQTESPQYAKQLNIYIYIYKRTQVIPVRVRIRVEPVRALVRELGLQLLDPGAAAAHILSKKNQRNSKVGWVNFEPPNPHPFAILSLEKILQYVSPTAAVEFAGLILGYPKKSKFSLLFFFFFFFFVKSHRRRAPAFFSNFFLNFSRPQRRCFHQ